MPIPKLKLLLSGLFACLINISCATPPDVPVCVELSPNEGYCANTISDNDTQLTDEQWHILKETAVIVPAESWAEIKAFILKSCRKSGVCKEKE